MFTDETELKKMRTQLRKWVHHITHKQSFNKKVSKIYIKKFGKFKKK